MTDPAHARDQLVTAWHDSVLSALPERTAGHLASSDAFANPVGTRLRAGLAAIVDGLVSGQPAAELRSALDLILRVRAVQEAAPSASLRFLLDLRLLGRQHLPSLPHLDAWVDELLLAAVDVFVACRNDMHRAQVRAIRRQSVTGLERLNSWCARKYQADDATATGAPPEGERMS